MVAFVSAPGGVTKADLSTITAQRVRVVGTNGRLRTTLLPTSTTHTTMEVEHFFYIGVDTPWIALSFDGWSTDNFGAVQLPPTALAIEGVSIINGGRTILRPLRKDGSRTFTVPIGGTLFSDRIHALEFGLPMFRRGTKYLIKMRLNVPASTGRFMTGATQFNPAGTYASRFDPTAGTNGTSQVDTLTPMTSKTGQTDYAAGYMFTAVIGEAVDSRIPTLVNIDGDSIAQSSIDTNGYGLESGSAMILRASFAADQTHPIPVLNMARGSSSVAGAIASLSTRSTYLPFVAGGIAISEGGTGDIGISGGGDIAVLKANLLTTWAALRAAGVQKIIRTHILPRNTSSNGYINTAGQIRVPAFDAKMLEMNSWFDQQLAAGVIDAVVTLNSLRDPGDPTLWRTHTTPSYYVADGTHPETPGHELIQAEIRPVIERLFPQVAT